MVWIITMPLCCFAFCKHVLLLREQKIQFSGLDPISIRSLFPQSKILKRWNGDLTTEIASLRRCIANFLPTPTPISPLSFIGSSGNQWLKGQTWRSEKGLLPAAKSAILQTAMLLGSCGLNDIIHFDKRVDQTQLEPAKVRAQRLHCHKAKNDFKRLAMLDLTFSYLFIGNYLPTATLNNTNFLLKFECKTEASF